MIHRMVLLVVLSIAVAVTNLGTPTPHEASGPVIDAAAQEELVDLAWLAPGPADLDDDRYGLTWGLYQPVAKGGVRVVGNPGPLTPYDEAFSRDANQTYYQAMAIPDDDDPDVAARTLVVVIGEFTDSDSAASGFADVVDLLAQTPDYPQSGRPPVVGDEARAFGGEFTDPADERVYQELRFVFRSGRFLADLSIYDYLDDAPATSELMPVAELLAERLDDAEAAGSPGLAGQVVRITNPALATFYDYYIRRGGDEIRFFGESTTSMETADEFFEDLGVTDGYYYLSEVRPSEDGENETYASLQVDLLLFTSSSAAETYLETAVDDWIEQPGAKYQDIETIDDAGVLGDDSAVVSFRQETTIEELSKGYRVWARAGDRVAIVELDGIPEIPLPVALYVAEAQLACFEAGTCPEPVPLSELPQAVPTEAIVTQPEPPAPLTPPAADAAAQATIAAQATRIAILEAPTSTPDAAQATMAAQATRIAQLEGTRTPPTIPPTDTPITPTTPVPTSTPDPVQATVEAQAARIATLEAQAGSTPPVPPEEPEPPGVVAPTLQEVCTVPGTATGIAYAEAVVAYDPRNPAGPIAEPSPEFGDPQRAVGPPDADPVSFLGALSLGSGGSLTLQFGDTVLVGDGTAAPELWVCEVGPPDAEGAVVAVSADGLTWLELGRVGGGTSELDLDALGLGAAGVRFVRLIDDPVADPGAFGSPGLDIDAVGAIVTEPLASPSGTPSPGTAGPPPPEPASATGEAGLTPEAPAEPDTDISPENRPLFALLPTQEHMPPGLVLADEGERSKEEVIAALDGTDEAAQLLDEWGWSGTVYREFIAAEANPSPSGTGFMNISVHRFADPEAAANAMVFFSDQVIFGQGLEEVESPAIGESARLLRGAPDGVPLSVLYAQQGPMLYRVGGASLNAEGDPTADVLAVASEILPQGENAADSPIDGTGASPAATLAADFITPDPAACTITPRTAEELTNLAASPDQAAIDALATASLDPDLSIPEGAPADAATVASVTETYQQLLACFNAGHDLAAYALWTDDALRQIQAAPPTSAPTPVPEGARSAVRMREVRMLPDGRVVAVWEQRDPAFTTTLVQRLVRQDERYVIDATVDALFAAISDETLVPQPATPEPMSPPLPVISPHIGVEYQDIKPDVAALNDLPVDYGAYVLNVVPGGPASNAGIRAGDIILAIDDQSIDAQTTFLEALFIQAPGNTVPVTLMRDGREQQVEVILAEHPDR